MTYGGQKELSMDPSAQALESPMHPNPRDFDRDMAVEKSFENVKNGIKRETRNKIDQLFDAAEAGDN